MNRTLSALILGLLLAPAFGKAPTPTATLPKAGTYAVMTLGSRGGLIYCLIKITPKADGIAGESVAVYPGIGGGMKFENVTLEGTDFAINCVTNAGNVMRFVFELPKSETEPMLGSFEYFGSLTPAQMVLTDRTELTMANASVPGAAPTAILQSQNQLRLASRNRATADQVREWADSLQKAAQPYGQRYVRDITKQIADVFVYQDGYGPLSLEYAQRADRQLTAKDAADQHKRVLGTLALAQRKTGKTSDAEATKTRLPKILDELDRDFLAKVPPFKPTVYDGRKSQSDRAVVVELFTGANCLPCVAADVAFDVLEKTYKPSEVVLLQYHFHIPLADPQTNATTEARARYYGMNSTPNVFFNGKREAGGDGSLAATENRYKQYRGVVDRLLEEPAKAGLKLGVNRQGDTITLRADVSNVTDPGDGTTLRFVLVEEAVRFVGNNRLRFHHMVVRAMPGGPDGLLLTAKEGQHSASVNFVDLRHELGQYLTDYTETKGSFRQPSRPMDLAHLKAIALVQDDRTKEILQAAVVAVGGEHSKRDGNE